MERHLTVQYFLYVFIKGVLALDAFAEGDSSRSFIKIFEGIAFAMIDAAKSLEELHVVVSAEAHV